ENGAYLVAELAKIDGVKNVRGKGLMIGFDVPEGLKDLRKNLLQKHYIFTGEAKPNVIRLLPALNISREVIDEFLEKLKAEVSYLQNVPVAQVIAQ
ncbi:MAG: aminotransferase class III-fold pyridoxal phosphate-dependent enzyme, partial [Chitinophagaceae bacterium]